MLQIVGRVDIHGGFINIHSSDEIRVGAKPFARPVISDERKQPVEVL